MTTIALDVARDPSIVNAALADLISSGISEELDKTQAGAGARELEEEVCELARTAAPEARRRPMAPGQSPSHRQPPTAHPCRTVGGVLAVRRADRPPPHRLRRPGGSGGRGGRVTDIQITPDRSPSASRQLPRRKGALLTYPWVEPAA